MYCPHCGAMLEENGNYCPFCGERLQEGFIPEASHDRTGQPYPYVHGQWLIGRSKSCDFVIPEDQISRQHCMITLTSDGTFLLEDLSSTNGTFLNGMRLQGPAILYPGDQVGLADTLLIFQIDNGYPVFY